MKMRFILFFILIIQTCSLLAQPTDSAAIQLELQRLNEIRDSITRAELGKDKLPPGEGNNSIPIDPATYEGPTSEKQANFDKVMKQLEQERNVLRNRILILVAGVFILLIWMRRVLNKQEQNKQLRKRQNPST